MNRGNKLMRIQILIVGLKGLGLLQNLKNGLLQPDFSPFVPR